MAATGHSRMYITKAQKHCWDNWSNSASGLLSHSVPKTNINGLMSYRLIKWLNVLNVKDKLLSGRFWHISPWKHIKISCHLKTGDERPKHLALHYIKWIQPKHTDSDNEYIKMQNFASSLCHTGMRKQHMNMWFIIASIEKVAQLWLKAPCHVHL